MNYEDDDLEPKKINEEEDLDLEGIEEEPDLDDDIPVDDDFSTEFESEEDEDLDGAPLGWAGLDGAEE